MRTAGVRQDWCRHAEQNLLLCPLVLHLFFSKWQMYRTGPYKPGVYFWSLSHQSLFLSLWLTVNTWQWFWTDCSQPGLRYRVQRWRAFLVWALWVRHVCAFLLCACGSVFCGGDEDDNSSQPLTLLTLLAYFHPLRARWCECTDSVTVTENSLRLRTRYIIMIIVINW